MIKGRLDEKKSRETSGEGSRVVLWFNVVCAPPLFARLSGVSWGKAQKTQRQRGAAAEITLV